MVALGAVFSAFWILAANSWMQTPAGFTIGADGKFQIADWSAAIFNPSLPYRFAHMVTAACIAGTFVVLGVSGFYLWQRRHLDFARAGFSIAMWLALVLTPLQIVIGDQHGLNTLEYQPMKLAAIEARWETARHVPITLFAWPDVAQERNDYALEHSRLGSLILTHSWNGEVKGLKEVPPDRSALCAAALLRLPHHGRHRRRAAGDRCGRALSALARAALRHALVRHALRLLEPVALHRHPRRLDGDRDRAAAL